VHVSAATVWELTIKTMLGKLTVPADLSKRLPAQVSGCSPPTTSCWTCTVTSSSTRHASSFSVGHQRSTDRAVSEALAKFLHS